MRDRKREGRRGKERGRDGCVNDFMGKKQKEDINLAESEAEKGDIMGWGC